MYIELMVVITGIPLAGLYLAPFFDRKEKDTTLKNKFKDEYDLARDTREFFIASINDHTIRFIAKVLDNKLV